MTAEDWIKRYKSIGIVEMINEIEKYAYNKGVKDALKLASEKAKVGHPHYSDGANPFVDPFVDKESILNLYKELVK